MNELLLKHTVKYILFNDSKKKVHYSGLHSRLVTNLGVMLHWFQPHPGFLPRRELRMLHPYLKRAPKFKAAVYRLRDILCSH